jgi:hypothetical protein
MPLPSKLSLIIITHASKKKKVLHSMSIIQYLNLIWERKTVIFFLLYIYIYIYIYIYKSVTSPHVVIFFFLFVRKNTLPHKTPILTPPVSLITVT